MQGQEDIVEFYERRFLPEFKIAFDAWIKLDPINNSSAPPGPRYMPQYHSSKMEEANSLIEEAAVKVEEGTKAIATAHDYITKYCLPGNSSGVDGYQSAVRGQVHSHWAYNSVIWAAVIWHNNSIYASSLLT